jgi:hypothetical protein
MLPGGGNMATGGGGKVATGGGGKVATDASYLHDYIP